MSLLIGGPGLLFLVFGFLFVLSGYMGRQELRITPTQIRSRAWALWKERLYDRAVPLAAVTGVEVRDATCDLGVSGTGVYSVFVLGGDKPVEYGSGLSERDQDWLCGFLRLVAGCARRAPGGVGDVVPVALRAAGPLAISSADRRDASSASTWTVIAVLLFFLTLGAVMTWVFVRQGRGQPAKVAPRPRGEVSPKEGAVQGE